MHVAFSSGRNVFFNASSNTLHRGMVLVQYHDENETWLHDLVYGAFRDVIECQFEPII